jgi:hypothetical protein
MLLLTLLEGVVGVVPVSIGRLFSSLKVVQFQMLLVKGMVTCWEDVAESTSMETGKLRAP